MLHFWKYLVDRARSIANESSKHQFVRESSVCAAWHVARHFQ